MPHGNIGKPNKISISIDWVFLKVSYLKFKWIDRSFVGLFIHLFILSFFSAMDDIDKTVAEEYKSRGKFVLYLYCLRT